VVYSFQLNQGYSYTNGQQTKISNHKIASFLLNSLTSSENQPSSALPLCSLHPVSIDAVYAPFRQEGNFDDQRANLSNRDSREPLPTPPTWLGRYFSDATLGVSSSLSFYCPRFRSSSIEHNSRHHHTIRSLSSKMAHHYPYQVPVT
jgi:hypothetical protein